MPNATLNPTLVAEAGYTQFTLTVPSTSPYSVTIWLDATGQNVVGTVAIGGNQTFYAPAGQFWVVGNGGVTGYTLTASQAFQAGAVVNQFTPTKQDNSILTNSTLGQNTLYFVPFDVNVSVNASRINFYASIATVFSASNATGSAGLTFSAALYSRGTGTGTATASDGLATFWSGSAFVQFSNSSNTNLTVTQPNGLTSNSVATLSTTFANANASTWLATSVGGFREIPMPVGLTLSPGRYVLAFAQSATSANASFVVNASWMQNTYSNQIAFAPFGTNSVASNASWANFNDNLGTYSATSGAFPASVAITGSLILGSPIMTAPMFNFSGYATNLSEL